MELCAVWSAWVRINISLYQPVIQNLAVYNLQHNIAQFSVNFSPFLVQEFLALKHFQFNNFINNYCECFLKSRSVVALHLVNRRCWGLRWTLWKCGRCLRSAAADFGSTSALPSIARLPVASSTTSFCRRSELNQQQLLFLISIFSKNVVSYFSESKCRSMDR